MANLLVLIIAYIIGSLSTALCLSKLLKLPDPRTLGSKNPGATNVLRTIGSNQAAAVLLGDILKGFLAVVLGHAMGIEGFLLGLVAFVAVIGHIFPIFFKFQGGKGVATALGALLALSPSTALLGVAIWAVVLFVFSYVSLASLAATASSAILLLAISNPQYAFPFLLIAAAITWRHKDNIERLKAKTEPKMSLAQWFAKTTKQSPPANEANSSPNTEQTQTPNTDATEQKQSAETDEQDSKNKE